MPPPRPFRVPPPILTALRGAARVAVGLVYPPLCVHCDARLPDRPDGAPLALCPRCARRLVPAEDGVLATLVAGAPFAPAVALWRNDAGGPFQALHHAVKYGNRPGLARAAGRLLAGALAGAAPATLVPVPTTRARRLSRGYNQAEAIADGLAEATGWPVEAVWLTRTGHARSQARLGRAARAANVGHDFAVPNGAPLAGRRVVLVDDVVTTGATARAAGEALRRAGAEVGLAVLAVTR